METKTVPTGVLAIIDAYVAEDREKELQLAQEQREIELKIAREKAAIDARRDFAERIRRDLASAGIHTALIEPIGTTEAPAASPGRSRSNEALERVNRERREKAAAKKHQEAIATAAPAPNV